MLALTPQQLATGRAALHAGLPRREVRAFGSRVSSFARRYSDLDLMLMGEEPVADIIRADLREDFDESGLPFRVDVVFWCEAPGILRKVVERDGVVIQSAQEARDFSKCAEGQTKGRNGVA
jgi:type I restriction enzyme S subunit